MQVPRLPGRLQLGPRWRGGSLKQFTSVPSAPLRGRVSGSNIACLGSCQSCCDLMTFISSTFLVLERRVALSGLRWFERGTGDRATSVSATDGMVATLFSPKWKRKKESEGREEKSVEGQEDKASSSSGRNAMVNFHEATSKQVFPKTL